MILAVIHSFPSCSKNEAQNKKRMDEGERKRERERGTDVITPIIEKMLNSSHLRNDMDPSRYKRAYFTIRLYIPVKPIYIQPQYLETQRKLVPSDAKGNIFSFLQKEKPFRR